MLHAFLIGLLVLAAPQAQSTRDSEKSEAAEKLEFRNISVRSMTLARPNREIPPLGPLLLNSFPYNQGREPWRWTETIAPIASDELTSAIRELTGPDLWERPGTKLEVRRGRLEIRNTRTVLDRVAATVERLRARLAPRLQFEIVLFDRRERPTSKLPASSSIARLTPNEADAWSKSFDKSGAGILHREVLETVPGTVAHSGSTQRGNYVADVSVEVARNAFISDPHVRTLAFDSGLSLLPLLQPDAKGIAFFGILTHRKAGPQRPMPIRSPDVDFIDQVECRETQAVFSLGLPGDGAFVFAPGGSSDVSLCLYVRLTRLSPAAAPTPADTMLYPHRLLTAQLRGLRLQRPRTVHGKSDNDDNDDEDQPEERLPHREASELQERIETVIQDVDPDVLTEAGDLILFRGDPKLVRAGRAAIENLARGRNRTFVVSVHLEARARNSDAGWQPLGRARSLPVMAFRPGMFMQGVGSSYVADANVEIAQGAAGPDPVVRAYFAGLQFLVTVVPGGERCDVELGVVNSVVDGIRPSQARSLVFDHLVGPRSRATQRWRSLSMKVGESRTLGQLPSRRIGGRTNDVRAKITLREIK